MSRWVLACMQGGDYVQDLLNIETVATLNLGFCRLHHSKLCSEEFARVECGKASVLADVLFCVPCYVTPCLLVL